MIDLSLIGQYAVNVRGFIEVPTDETMSSYQTMEQEYTVLVTIEPCTVDAYIASLQVSEIRYSIGSPDKTDGPFAFEQQPSCGYPEVITMTNLPAFATHNVASSDFTITQNSDLSILGAYTVTVEGVISVPDDYTLTTFTDMVVTYDFLIYIDPCFVDSIYILTQASPLQYFIGDTSLTGGHYAFT